MSFREARKCWVSSELGMCKSPSKSPIILPFSQDSTKSHYKAGRSGD